MPDSFEYLENDVMEFTDGSDATLCDILTGAFTALFGIGAFVLSFFSFPGAVLATTVLTGASLGVGLAGGIASGVMHAKEGVEYMKQRNPTPGF